MVWFLVVEPAHPGSSPRLDMGVTFPWIIPGFNLLAACHVPALCRQLFPWPPAKARHVGPAVNGIACRDLLFFAGGRRFGRRQKLHRRTREKAVGKESFAGESPCRRPLPAAPGPWQSRFLP